MILYLHTPRLRWCSNLLNTKQIDYTNFKKKTHNVSIKYLAICKMKLWLFTDHLIRKLYLSKLRIRWSVTSSKLPYSSINGRNRMQWRLPRRSTLTMLPRRWKVVRGSWLLFIATTIERNTKMARGSWFVAEEEEEESNEEEEGSVWGAVCQTKMALRKKKNEVLCEDEEESKGLWGRRRRTCNGERE